MSKSKSAPVAKLSAMTPHDQGRVIRETNEAMTHAQLKVETARVAILEEAHRVAKLIDYLEDVQEALSRLYKCSTAADLIQNRIDHRSAPPAAGVMRSVEPALIRG